VQKKVEFTPKIWLEKFPFFSLNLNVGALFRVEVPLGSSRISTHGQTPAPEIPASSLPGPINLPRPN